MIGYDDIGNNPKCYRIYIPPIGKYIKSGHVTFDEATFPVVKQKQPVTRVELHDDAEEDGIDSIKTVGAHQEDEHAYWILSWITWMLKQLISNQTLRKRYMSNNHLDMSNMDQIVKS
ncbi:hypothetical protein Naga_100417g5 [Nannochloropsis gaditana]|uniref:Retroviral polymerase SH3-like domain-containing protein n=1 Tax=Nannochloropsis gaditana TaxID=72520 RepID=W7SZV2_9STRA|nr:hypothetical protein Naga_100417g5 [Nannochloropsis gaditana]